MKTYKLKIYFVAIFLLVCSGTAISVITNPTEYMSKDAAQGPNDNFYLHANGEWLANLTQKKSCTTIKDEELEAVDIIRNKCRLGGFGNTKISALYASLSNVDATTLKSSNSQTLALIDNMSSKQKIPLVVAYLRELGVKSFLVVNAKELTHINSNKTASKVWGISILRRDRMSYLMEKGQIEDIFQGFGFTIQPAEVQMIIDLDSKLSAYDDYGQFIKYDRNKFDILMKNNYWNDYLVHSGLFNSRIDTIVTFPEIESYLKMLYNDILSTNPNAFPLDGVKVYLKYLVLIEYRRQLGILSTGRNIPVKEKIDNLLTNDFKSDHSLRNDFDYLCFNDYIEYNRPKILEMFENIKESYRRSIDQTTWSNETKELVRKKLNAITVAMPNTALFYIDFSRATITVNDPISNIENIERAKYKQILVNFGKTSSDYQGPGVDRLPYYEIKTNVLNIPANSKLFLRFYDTGNPAYDIPINHGWVGISIGHEIAHAFDLDGRKFDDTGKTNRVLPVTDDANYKQVAQRLEYQYRIFRDGNSDMKNDMKFAEEDIADNMGIEMSYQTAIRVFPHIMNSPTPVVNGVNANQLFFYTWAHYWRYTSCENVDYTTHSPDEVRVNGPFRNFPPFHKAFGINPGDKMFLPQNQLINFGIIP